MKSIVLAILLVGTLFVSGCQTTSSDWCLTNKPYRPQTEAELQSMADKNVEQALAHNRYGEKLCGWKP